jgi:hypothetical protein
MWTAINDKGETILISEANTKTPYSCPSCKERLIVRHGEKNAKHFSHLSDTSCVLNHSHSKGETVAHLHGKELFKMFLERKHQISIIKHCSRCFQEKTDVLSTDDVDVSCEQRLDGGGIADLLLSYKDGRKVIVEIFTSHKTENREGTWYEISADDVIKSKHLNNHSFHCTRKDRRCSLNCLSMKDLAIKLGYLSGDLGRSFEEVKLLWKDNMVSYSWKLYPESFLDPDSWKTFETRQRCIVCCKRCDISFRKPYCHNCYVRVFYGRMAVYSELPSPELKKRILDKYSFLKAVPHVNRPEDIATIDDIPKCIGGCGRKLDGTWTSSCPFFFYGYRQICYICVSRVCDV